MVAPGFDIDDDSSHQGPIPEENSSLFLERSKTDETTSHVQGVVAQHASAKFEQAQIVDVDLLSHGDSALEWLATMVLRAIWAAFFLPRLVAMRFFILFLDFSFLNRLILCYDRQYPSRHHGPGLIIGNIENRKRKRAPLPVRFWKALIAVELRRK